MKKIIISTVLALTFIAPASAGASDTATVTANLAVKTALEAKTKAELALVKAKQAETTAKKTVKDVEALRIKTMSQLKAVKKQLDTLTKLLKTL